MKYIKSTPLIEYKDSIASNCPEISSNIHNGIRQDQKRQTCDY